MASYVADTKEQAEAKKELIATLMGLVMCHSYPNLERLPDKLMWIKPNETEYLRYARVQRAAYIDLALDHTKQLGIVAGLWEDWEGAKMTGQQVVMDYVHQKEKDDLAMSLREIAKKLESAAETLSSAENDRRGCGAVKRRREEDFEEVENELEDATNAMRNFKRAKVSQERAPDVGQRIEVPSKIQLISTQPALASAQPQGIPTTNNATAAEDEPESGHRSLIITLKVPRLKSRAPSSETVATQNLDPEASMPLDRTKLQCMI